MYDAVMPAPPWKAPSLAHSFSIDIMVSSINFIEMQQDEPWWWNGRLGWKNDECCVLPAMTRGLVRGWWRLKNVCNTLREKESKFSRQN